MKSAPRRFAFGTVQMSCVDLHQGMETFFDAATSGRGGVIACTCTHGIVEAERDARLRAILNGTLMTLPDGMPTVWVGRAKGMPVGRVTAPDFLEAVMRDRRAPDLRHFFYGASEQTLRRIVERARDMIGDAAVVGSHSPPLRAAGAAEDLAVIERIAALRPDVVWVSLGLPKQEYWMERYAPALPTAVMVGVGAAFDWFAGAKPRAPKWLQAVGLEWLHRLASEPQRLWPRYRAVVPRALTIMVREMRPGERARSAA